MPGAALTVLLNGTDVTTSLVSKTDTNASGEAEFQIALSAGVNTIVVTATKGAFSGTSEARSLRYFDSAPTIAIDDLKAVINLADASCLAGVQNCLATITANSQGFFVMGLTTSPPPNLLPGRLFTGQIPPSKINEIFVGGQLPPTVAYRREITSTDEIGPTSQLSQGSNTVVFSTINLSGDVLISILGSDGKIIDWADTIYQPSNVTVRRTYALTNGPGNGNIVAWAEYDANNKYRAYVRSMLCF